MLYSQKNAARLLLMKKADVNATNLKATSWRFSGQCLVLAYCVLPRRRPRSTTQPALAILGAWTEGRSNEGHLWSIDVPSAQAVAVPEKPRRQSEGGLPGRLPGCAVTCRDLGWIGLTMKREDMPYENALLIDSSMPRKEKTPQQTEDSSAGPRSSQWQVLG